MAEQTGEMEDALAYAMLEQTVTALRMFVNDELNELEFALRVVAENLLKPGGILLAIVHTDPEAKIIFDALEETTFVAGGPMGNVRLSQTEIKRLEKCRPWEMVLKEPMPLSQAEKSLHPRFASASLYVARRTDIQRTQQQS